MSEAVRLFAAMPEDWLREKIEELVASAEGWPRRRFRIGRFRDGQDIGLPTWARHLCICGYGEQGWSAADQRQGGRTVAQGPWGGRLILLSKGRLTGDGDRANLKALRAALKLRLSTPQATDSDVDLDPPMKRI